MTIATLTNKSTNKLTNNQPTTNHTQEGKEIKKLRKSRGFTPPSVEEVAAYCQERNNRVDPQRFVDFYQSKNWMVGKTKMKDWKASVRTWENRNKTQSNQSDDWMQRWSE